MTVRLDAGPLVPMGRATNWKRAVIMAVATLSGLDLGVAVPALHLLPSKHRNAIPPSKSAPLARFARWPRRVLAEAFSSAVGPWILTATLARLSLVFWSTYLLASGVFLRKSAVALVYVAVYAASVAVGLVLPALTVRTVGASYVARRGGDPSVRDRIDVKELICSYTSARLALLVLAAQLAGVGAAASLATGASVANVLNVLLLAWLVFPLYWFPVLVVAAVGQVARRRVRIWRRHFLDGLPGRPGALTGTPGAQRSEAARGAWGEVTPERWLAAARDDLSRVNQCVDALCGPAEAPAKLVFAAEALLALFALLALYARAYKGRSLAALADLPEFSPHAFYTLLAPALPQFLAQWALVLHAGAQLHWEAGRRALRSVARSAHLPPAPAAAFGRCVLTMDTALTLGRGVRVTSDLATRVLVVSAAALVPAFVRSLL